MIAFARRIDEDARKLRKRFEDEVEEPERQAYGELAKVRFAVLGRAVPPDATFTLRLAYGVVKGYPEGGGAVPYSTRFAGDRPASTFTTSGCSPPSCSARKLSDASSLARSSSG